MAAPGGDTRAPAQEPITIARARDFVPRHRDARPRFIRGRHHTESEGEHTRRANFALIWRRSRRFLAVPRWSGGRPFRAEQRPNLQNRRIFCGSRAHASVRMHWLRRTQPHCGRQWECTLWRTVKWPTWLVQAFSNYTHSKVLPNDYSSTEQRERRSVASSTITAEHAVDGADRPAEFRSRAALESNWKCPASGLPEIAVVAEIIRDEVAGIGGIEQSAP